MNPILQPWDAHNQELTRQVHPSDWSNPEPRDRYDLVVIGAGTAGLVTAAGAAGLGARVALVEKHLLGGDCLNVGCVPSKTLIRSARALTDTRRASALGIQRTREARADFPAVMERMRQVRARISRHDSVERFSGLGVDVFLGEARFRDRRSIQAGDRTLAFRKCVIASGARAAVPPIPGLAEAGYLTNETIFSLTELPARLAIIGAGPIGCEMAQTFARLGAEVLILEMAPRILPRDDADAAAILRQSVQGDGVALSLNCKILRVEKEGAAKVVVYSVNGREERWPATSILAGAGRAPNVDGMNLEAAGVQYDRKRGILVDDHLRTTAPNIFAAGDVCMDARFTHAADFAARIVIQNALFRGRKRLSALTIPWCTYTDPEVAGVGLNGPAAEQQGRAIQTFQRDFAEVDRAITDGEVEGFVKIHVDRGSDRIVGATIVAAHAGDLISEISVAMAGGLGLGALANVIHPYPTRAEAIRQCGDAFNRTRLTPLAKRLLSGWLAITR